MKRVQRRGVEARCDGGRDCRCCECWHQCPGCQEFGARGRCLGGHAYAPNSHMCVELHHWITSVE